MKSINFWQEQIEIINPLFSCPLTF